VVGEMRSFSLIYIHLKSCPDLSGRSPKPPAALAGRMARKGIHFAKTAAAPRDVVFSDKDPETRDKKSLISIAGILDAFHMVDGIFPKRTIR